MRVLILSDIHSNAVALETVLADAGSYDQLWNLGDTIGYGPQPNECMAAMRAHANYMILGNHDMACIGSLDLSDFNPDARTANIWNGKQLFKEHHQALLELQNTLAIDERFLLAHGSPREPVWEYLLTRAQAIANFKLFKHAICFIGHSHVPLIFQHHTDGRCDGPASPEADTLVHLQPEMRYIINPGSVGQPRNQDPRAAYVMFDTEANTVLFRRVSYDVGKTQDLMNAANLPEMLVVRLQYGM